MKFLYQANGNQFNHVSFKFYIACIFAIFQIFTFRTIAKDNELWLGSEFALDFTKDLNLEIGEQFRFYKNISLLQQSITDIGLKYLVHKYFESAAFYRLQMRYEQDNKIFTPRHEFNFNLYFNYKLENFQLTYRLKYQYEFIRNKDENEQNIRNRLKIRANHLKNIKPFLLSELFYRCFWSKGDRFDKYRLSIGVDWKLEKMHTLTAFYMHEEEFNLKSPDISNIFGIYYSFSISDLNL